MSDKTIEECIIFIDDGYLAKISEHFAGGLGKGSFLKFDLQQFPITLAKEKGCWCKEVYFYTAPPYMSSNPTDDERARRQRHDNFVDNILRKKFGWIVREGRCQKGEKGEFHQKGVDNLIDIDLMEICHNQSIKTIIFLACDTDFVPILNKVRSDHKINVILAYFSDRQRGSAFSMSNHLLTACDDTILLERKHFKVIGIKKKHS